jgi:hypothetical protein
MGQGKIFISLAGRCGLEVEKKNKKGKPTHLPYLSSRKTC